jgi:hypothetical protein
MPRILLTPLAQRLLQLAVIIDNADNPGVVRTMIHRFNEVLIEIRKSQPRSSHHPSSFVIETEQYERIRNLIGATWLKEQLMLYPKRALGPVSPGALGVLEYFKKLADVESDFPWNPGTDEKLFQDLENTRNMYEPF